MLKLLSIGRGQIFLACPTLCVVVARESLLTISSECGCAEKGSVQYFLCLVPLATEELRYSKKVI